jgi:hypothetical protein
MTETSEQVKKVADLAKGIRIGMLTTVDADGHFISRPMAQQEVEFDGDLWFFAERGSRKGPVIQPSTGTPRAAGSPPSSALSRPRSPASGTTAE